MHLNQIESLLLHGAHFTKEQREVIQASGRINVIAGPGSGKTTVLAAKVLLLLTNRRPEDKGICCITHTNVAVNEILERLKAGGIDEVKYPNFVGTIQSFMDTFLGRAAFAKILPGISMKLLEEDKYKERYEKNFRRIVTDYPADWNAPKPSNWKCELIISDDASFKYQNSSKKFKVPINQACTWLLQDGIASYDDLKSMADWYLKQHKLELSNAFSERFSFLMLDEAQDTSHIQLEIINGLTQSKTLNVQRFGDPYQSLYTIYGTETEDSWKPYDESPQFLTKEISETTRFGSRIASLVRDVCVEEYSQFHSCQQKGDFPNYFITYNTGDELKEKHTLLIEKATALDADFKALKKTDAIVGVMKDDLRKIESEFTKTSAKLRGRQRNVNEIYTRVLKLLAITNGISQNEEAHNLRKNTHEQEILALVVQQLADGKISEDELYDYLLELINIDSAQIEGFKEDCKHLIYVVSVLEEKPVVSKEENLTVHREFATIHAVKGETHRSTVLLLDSCVHNKFGDSEWENSTNKFFQYLFPYLIGERPDFSNNPEVRKLQQDCLKLAYVALSRPKYLAAIAIHESNLDDDKRTQLLAHGWIEAQ